MGNFKDFDLDLRNVAESGTVDPNGYGSTLLCSAIKLTLQQKCNSVELRLLIEARKIKFCGGGH